MTRRDPRVEALRQLHADTGRPMLEIVRAAWPHTSRLAAHALATEAEAAGPPEAAPDHDEQVRQHVTIEQARAERQKHHDANALDAWEAFTNANPFEQARIRLRVGASTLDRGRQLAEASTPDPEPPQAA